MKKRLLSILLAVCMVAGLLPGFTITAMAAGEVTLLVNTSAADDSATRGVGAKYKTLAGAVAKAVSGDTIKLETDCLVDATVVVEGVTLTLDLNDKLITCSVDNSYYTNYAINVGSGGTLTVTDTANGTGKIQYASPIVVTSNGTVNVAGGTVKAVSAGNGPAIHCNNSAGTVNVTGGTVILDNGGYEGYGAINGAGTVNISGGNVVGTGATPAIKFVGTVNVSGGYINSLSSLSGSTAYVTGGNIGLFRIFSGGTAYVTGGTINTINNDGTLKNLNSQSLSLYVFTGGDPNTAVSSLSVTPALGYTYGLNDVKTDGEGKIYVWLPAGKTNASVTAGGKTMTIDFRIRGEEISTGVIFPYPGRYGQTFDFSGTGYSGRVTWSPSAYGTPFLPGTVYTGTFILTAVGSYTFTGMTGDFTVSGATSVTASDNTGTTLKLTAVFPETPSPQAVTVAVKKDGTVWTGHGKSFALYEDGSSAYTLNSSGYNASVFPGTYDIYEGATDTGVDITVSKGGANSAEVNYYTVTFKSEDGSTTLNTQTVLVGKTAAYGGTTPNKATDAQYSYTFSKWVTMIDGSDEAALNNITSSKTVFASFTSILRSYTITWKKDDSTVIGTTTIDYGLTPSYVAPAKTGYSFAGWTPDIGSVTGDAIYTASWTADPYSISYVLNGGTVSTTNPDNYTIESTAITLNNPNRSGYSFVGWSGTDLTGTANQAVTIPAGSTGAKSYNANWKADTPSMPDVSIVTAKSRATLTIAAQEGYEYSVDNGTHWYSGIAGSITFTGLTPATVYNLVCRKAEVTSLGSASAASDASAALAVTTKNAAPAAPALTFDGITANTVTMSAVIGGEYSMDGGATWQVSNTFTSLTAATKYSFAVRIQETADTEGSEATTVDQYTAAATPAAGEGYTIDYHTEIINIVSGYEVSANDDFGTTLINGASITPGAAYYVRKAEDAGTTPDTPASEAVGLTLPQRPEMPAASAIAETVAGKNDGKISGVTAAMEWKVNGGSYAAVTADQVLNGITGLSDGTYFVRYMAVSGTGFKSAEQEITIAAGHTITVTFNSQSGSDVAAITGKAYGDNITAPANPTRSGFYFAGWYKEPTCTNVWTFTLDTLTGNITLFAKWSAIPTYTVTGSVVDDASHAVEGAAVRMMQGAVQFGTAGVTDLHGDFTIDNIPPGIYNLVISKDTKTAIVKVEVSNGNVAIGNAVLPSGNANSILFVKGSGTPNVVVGGLDREAGAQLLGSGDPLADNVEVKLTVEEKDAATAANGSEVTGTVTAAGKQVGMILAIDVNKKVNGIEDTSYIQTSEPIEIIIPLPAELQGKATYAIYRYHGAAVDTITETPNADLERIVIDRTNWMIALYANKFSTYAIGYTNPASPRGGGGGTASSTTAAAIERQETVALPYYVENGKEFFIGFASNAKGTMKYIAPEGMSVLFRENPKSFNDIKGHWAKDNIDFVTQRELFLGTGDGNFSPQSGMTRAMFAAVIGRLYERSYGKLPGKDERTFADVDGKAYYKTYIDWASENNIITGTGGGLFKPDREITRQEMAAILYRFAELLNVLPSGSDKIQLNYPDTAEIASWATEAAKYCQQTGIITGRSGGNFVPQGAATRAEVAAILQRFIENSVK